MTLQERFNKAVVLDLDELEERVFQLEGMVAVLIEHIQRTSKDSIVNSFVTLRKMQENL